MITYPEDSVLHRHMQSALQFTEVAVPDIPSDSVLHRHAADISLPLNSAVSEPVNTKAPAATKPVVSKTAEKPPAQETPTPAVTQAEQPASGLFAWFKRLLGG